MPEAWSPLGCKMGGEHTTSMGLQCFPPEASCTPHSTAHSKPQSKGICHQNKWPAILAGSKSWEQMVFCLNNCFQQQFLFQDGFFSYSACLLIRLRHINISNVQITSTSIWGNQLPSNCQPWWITTCQGWKDLRTRDHMWAPRRKRTCKRIHTNQGLGQNEKAGYLNTEYSVASNCD
jgi:hypothetical protein